jgi:hypothetical protein
MNKNHQIYNNKTLSITTRNKVRNFNWCHNYNIRPMNKTNLKMGIF